MKCISLPSGRFARLPEGCFIALGCFDGLHAGHNALLRRAADLAKEKGLSFALWTPRGAKDAPHILSRAERLRALGELHVEYYIEEPFQKIRGLSARAFFEEYLIGKYRAAGLACGENFTFGVNAGGNADTLRALCREYGIDLYVQKSVKEQGVTVSDSLIRSLLKSGRVAEARKMTSVPYGFAAKQEKGRGIGGKLGYPTVNLPLPDGFLLPNGVYAGELTFRKSGAAISAPAVINVGVHPTFEAAKKPLCEAHLLDTPKGGVPVGTVNVRFYLRLRSEIAFSSPEKLREQIARDVLAAKDFFCGKDLPADQKR